MALRDLFRSQSSAPTATHSVRGQAAPLVSPWAQENHLAQMTLADLYAGADAPAWIDRAAALELPALAKAVRVITTTIARCPIVARRGTDVAESSVLAQMTPGLPNSVVVAAMLDSLIFYGRAWLVITRRDRRGLPLDVEFVPMPQCTEDAAGRLIRANDREVSPADTVRIDALTAGILTTGQSVLRDAMELRHAAIEVGSTPLPSVLLRAVDPAIRQDELEDMQARWVAARRRRHGTAAAVSRGVEVETMPAPSSALLTQGQNAAAVDVARLVGLPAWVLDASGDGSSLTYSNSASRMRELVEFGLAPYITALEDGLTYLLPQGQTAKVNTDELVNSDRAARLADYATGLGMGLYTLDEVREWEGLPPLPEPEPAPDPPADTETDTTDDTETES